MAAPILVLVRSLIKKKNIKVLASYPLMISLKNVTETDLGCLLSLLIRYISKISLFYLIPMWSYKDLGVSNRIPWLYMLNGMLLTKIYS